ncbi:MAG: hypothetical protein FWG84_10325 [Bacteroidales bacterium]|nr:hypothetical protein [Bacteroidales bacterium]
MKRFAKFTTSIIVDLAIVVSLTLSFIIIAESASGFVFSGVAFLGENSLSETLCIWATPFCAILLIYTVVSLVFRRSIAWLTIKKGGFRKALKLFFASIIDFTVILLITILVDYALQTLFYYDFFVLLLAIFAMYCFSVALCGGVSLGKWFFGIKFNAGNCLAIFKYMLYKILCAIILPVLLFRILGIVDAYSLFLNAVFCLLLFYVFSFIILRIPIWTYFAKISYIAQNQKIKFVSAKFICLLLLIVTGFISIKYINNRAHADEDILFGINYPYEFKKYPNKEAVKPYTDFLKTQNQSPKEYILNLFKQHDIVVLQEVYHGESTQWEMIFDIVSDTAFINNVGNVFTEYGSVLHQHKIDTFLNTVFPNDTILEQETACLMYYMSGGFYYFIKNLNLLNSELPDTLKIREHYCDAIDCDDIVAFIESKSDPNQNRDSLMAQVTIDWYNEQVANGKKHKCLVVTNSRHAHGYAKGIDYVKNHPSFRNLTESNQGQYIWEKYPEETATVMQLRYIGSRNFAYFPIYRPVNKGKWNLAFEINQNKPVGFNLENTPFGNDIFDAYSLRGARTTLKYEDIFTGIIFNKPYLELNEVYHPYQLYAITQAIKNKNINLEDPQNNRYVFYSQFFDDEANMDKNMRWARTISFSNFAPIFIFILLSLVSLSSGILYFITTILKKKKV